jgi:hypothetical protein
MDEQTKGGVMKKVSALSAMVLFLAGAPGIHAEGADRALVVTSSNAQVNQLLVYDSTGTLVQTVPTQGQGGVGNNAGGIASQNSTVAVVNFGSQSVSVLALGDHGFTLRSVLSTVSPPVSVAFGKDHLYILGTTTVESHRIQAPSTIDATADGVATLSRADGSSAQVGVVGDQLVISEKSGAIEVVDLRDGAPVGAPVEVDIPADSDTPFGLVTRGSNGYVTIAHSDEISLIKDGQLVALAATGSNFPNGPGQQAPCWITLVGPYLFTSNSPSHTISRLVATGSSITLDAPVVAGTTGAPIDIAAQGDLLAVVEDNGGGQAHLTQFSIDADGALTQTATTAISSPANGVAIVFQQSVR